MTLIKKYQVHHILVKYEFEAADILKKLAEGKDFSELAKKFSICSSAASGGNLGTVAIGKADADFEEAALNTAKGEITKKPIRSRFGFHLIKRIS